MAISTDERPRSVLIDLPTPHTFDLGNLLVNDPNPISSNPSAPELAAVARTCAQSLLNQLLTTCPIHTSRSSSTADAGSVLMQLPPPNTPLPREKPLPKKKEKTTWEKFAEKKGIRDKKKGEGKMEFDAEKGEWVPKWGYKGKGGGDEEWIVEVDEKKKKKQDEGKKSGGRTTGKQGEEKAERTLGEGRRERKENARRNERKMRANEKKARRGRGGD